MLDFVPVKVHAWHAAMERRSAIAGSSRPESCFNFECICFSEGGGGGSWVPILEIIQLLGYLVCNRQLKFC